MTPGKDRITEYRLEKKENIFLEKGPVGRLQSHPELYRYEGNPILTSADVPYPVNLAFNAGVAVYQGKYYMAFRCDVFKPDNNFALRHSGTGFAVSDDGIQWQVFNEEIQFHYNGTNLLWVNDARLTVIEERLYLSFCFNSMHGERPGIAVWTGGVHFEVIYLGVPAQRNLILCPDKICGNYWRLERPHTKRSVSDIWISLSPDLKYWGDAELLLGVEDVAFANVKIGGGPPPIKTHAGYLMIFHAVDNDPARTISYPNGTRWQSRYTAGVALLDSADPKKVIGISHTPLLVPETEYETGNIDVFWRENVVFPCGAILDDDEMLKLYYGAGDYSVCIASIHLNDILASISPVSRHAQFAVISPENFV